MGATVLRCTIQHDHHLCVQGPQGIDGFSTSLLMLRLMLMLS